MTGQASKLPSRTWTETASGTAQKTAESNTGSPARISVGMERNPVAAAAGGMPAARVATEAAAAFGWGLTDDVCLSHHLMTAFVLKKWVHLLCLNA